MPFILRFSIVSYNVLMGTLNPTHSLTHSLKILHFNQYLKLPITAG